MGSNPNTLTASFPAYHSRRMQVKRGKETIYKEICSFEEKETLAKGTVVTRPYRSKLIVNTLGADGSYTRQALVDTAQTLTIDQEKETSFYLRTPDEIQSNFKTANLYSDDAMMALDEWTDGKVLAEAANATSVVGNYEMGGGGALADGIGFTLSVSNVASVFSKVRQKMKRYHASKKSRWAAISEEFFDVLWLYLQGKDSALGDKVSENPNDEGVFAGFQLLVTESNYWTARLEIADIATANDTIVINGVTFTAVATPTAAGDFDVEASASVQATTIALAINNTTGYAASVGSTDTYIELTAANRLLLDGIVATAGASYVTLAGYGIGWVAVSETLTHTSSIWTTTKQIQHNLFGQGKTIDLVVQKYPKLEMVPRSGYVGKDFVAWMLLGLKSFKEGADVMVDVICRTDAFV